MEDTATPVYPAFDELLRPDEWVERFGGNVISTVDALEWLIRTNPELRESPHFHPLSRGTRLGKGFVNDVARVLGVRPLPIRPVH